MSRIADIEADPALLGRAAAGDLAAREALYRLLAGPAFSLARRLVPNRATAEDLFQDALMQVFERLGQFRGEAPFGAWVRRIVVHRCLMHLRSPWHRARIAWYAEEPPDGGDATASAAPDPEHIDLERALARLAPTTRAVLWLHDVEGLTHQEIAAQMGRTPSFSKSQLARGHARLRELLQDGPLPCPATPTP